MLGWYYNDPRIYLQINITCPSLRASAGRTQGVISKRVTPT